ncbi:MarR family transcriptional regulator [Aquihabitans sp. G128]|uniref:MarR family winged helix-turn-helix transcriptional regulator n=1 Tax=Aquihabitans sp. G128 TaxID=2849779 RepID=UPI001C22B0D3|nr:MarR family transcriptional regulator [Aquihabitans sp. G128]QXC59883.1 MarR family transcriptional regulator [Aquihabitans sp. G128]
MLADAGSSLPHFVLLSGLHRNPGLSQRELGAFAGLEGSTITHHLDRLERDGTITRTRDAADRRVIRVALTAEGEAQFARLDAAADEHDAELLAALGERDAASLRRILHRLQTTYAEEG